MAAESELSFTAMGTRGLGDPGTRGLGVGVSELTSGDPGASWHGISSLEQPLRLVPGVADKKPLRTGSNCCYWDQVLRPGDVLLQ